MVKPVRSLSTIFHDISSGKEPAFNELFTAYYEKLILFAKYYVKQKEIAEELVSAFFVRLWLKRAQLSTVGNPAGFLYSGVKNAALNHIRDQQKHNIMIREQEAGELFQFPENSDAAKTVDQKELQEQLRKAIAALPEQRQLIFRLVKEDGLKCKEVATLLDLSVRTIENQVYHALKSLSATIRSYLGYLPK
ncbi:RNA polymerase sigma-70 factor [Chitinophaga sancti]|uniref:RNA polymerase sigma-70 factor n=1 Tax=Chitinophaga sancti TaxID=1004 RepID=A0A1K1QMU7_9BACT|nr:RNA polymerase sigma-70 factor [Chitinophaga sancti]WQD65085.1 RNA polymerase sigma-70 factor [Chitinophaga sancti]WQG89291.1 RNA polymerase sigma-70 factor [Chitinophaga sancti]SFW61258.1 RNA polymerase sigma-70 factor, ECF subfamily [Chitinophaga sancti]